MLYQISHPQKDCFASPVRGRGTESLSGLLIQPLDRFGHCKGGFSGARGRCAQPLGVILGSRLSGLYHRLRARSRGEQPRGIQDERELRCHMNERRQQRVEEPERGKSDADRVHRDCAHKLARMIPRARRAMPDALANFSKSFPSSTTSALSRATSVPEPIATPTWASIKAGASLIPSPTIATMRP